MSYPPVIDDASMFPAAPQGSIVAPCVDATGRCSLSSLTLAEHPAAGFCFDRPAAMPLAAGAQGRYVMAPIVDHFAVAWTLEGSERVTGLRLELFRRDDPMPFWWKNLDFEPGGAAAAGATAFDGDLRTDRHLDVPQAAVEVGAALGGHFPREVLTAECAPYKLLMRIVRVDAATAIDCAARWVYLDVVVHEIALQLGAAAWIPAGGPTYADRRYTRLTTATHAGVMAQLAGGELGAAAPPAVTVPLTTNVFARSSADFYSNAIFVGQKLLFRDGPTLPLQATVRLRRSNGSGADARAGASALGALALQWDWDSVDRPVHPDPTAQKFIADALAYKPADWPNARTNCHVDRGGKRGGQAPHFMALPAGLLPAPADAIAPIGNRPWATSSRPVADSADPCGGQAGVLFLPSRIAGDSYRLRVCLGYPALGAFDVAANGALAAAVHDSVCVQSAATLTVHHRVDVAHQWKKQANVDDTALDWARVRAYFAAACVDLHAPQVAVINGVDYQHAAQLQFAQLRAAQRFALAPAASQDQGGHGITFLDFATYRAAVRAHATDLHQHLTNGPPLNSVDALLRAQIDYLGLFPPDTYHPDDLLLSSLAHLVATADALEDFLLGSLGINSEATYKERCESWGDDIIAGLCGAHAGDVSPREAGIHFYHFDFADQWFHQTMAARAAASVPNEPACPECAAPTSIAVAEDCRVCACGFRFNESALVMSVAPFACMNGVETGWAQHLSLSQRAKIRAGRMFDTTAAMLIAHEIGHQLGLPHAGPHALGDLPMMQTTGVDPAFHDADDDACLMSYNMRQAPRLHFCGLCSLRIAGWSMGPSRVATHPVDHQHDFDTVPLSSRSAFNQARAPLPGAVRQSPAPVHCASCGRSFGFFRPSYHCPLCGGVFCGDHSEHERPVLNGLRARPDTDELVCNGCAILANPKDVAAGARWDTTARYCAHQGCNVEFSFTNRRYNCRACGKMYCAAHAHTKAPVRNALSEAGPISRQRVCDACNALYG